MTERKCSRDDCDRPYTGKTGQGLCTMHYSRLRKGTPMDQPPTMIMFGASAEKRFWARVEKTDTCWLWTGGLTTGGYGMLGIGQRTEYVHRFAYELLVGAIPDGFAIDHICRVRHCVNPDHLRATTPAQNGQNLPVRHDSTTGIRGVQWHKTLKKFQARVMVNGVWHRSQGFDTVEEAEQAAIALRNHWMTHNVE